MEESQVELGWEGGEMEDETTGELIKLIEVL
jgi:hypothetical protein